MTLPKFNKMYVMVPVMLLARKIDSEDPVMVYRIRVAYAVVQVVSVLVVLYTYVMARSAAFSKKNDHANQIIYVPPPATPFPPTDPNAPKRYTETRFGAQLLSTARSLLGSTVFGIALTVGLHYYKGMVMGLAIQTVMAPLNLLENPLVKALLVGKGLLQPQDRLFDEKMARELTDADEVIDEHGQPVARNRRLGNGTGTGTAGSTAGSTGSAASAQPSFEEILLDTWDQGNKADLGSLMKALNKSNVNHRTKEDQWTPLMILSGLGAKGAVSAIRAAKELGADVAATDKEGWTALHWAAFHGSLSAAQELSSETKLLTVKDKEGLVPLETARKEGNDAVAAIYEKAMAGAGTGGGGDESKKSK